MKQWKRIVVLFIYILWLFVCYTNATENVDRYEESNIEQENVTNDMNIVIEETPTDSAADPLTIKESETDLVDLDSLDYVSLDYEDEEALSGSAIHLDQLPDCSQEFTSKK